MPDISLTIAGVTRTRSISPADATRFLNALAAERGVATTPAALVPVLLRECFDRWANEVKRIEKANTAIADIPFTES